MSFLHPVLGNMLQHVVLGGKVARQVGAYGGRRRRGDASTGNEAQVGQSCARRRTATQAIQEAMVKCVRRDLECSAHVVSYVLGASQWEGRVRTVADNLLGVVSYARVLCDSLSWELVTNDTQSVCAPMSNVRTQLLRSVC